MSKPREIIIQCPKYKLQARNKNYKGFDFVIKSIPFWSAATNGLSTNSYLERTPFLFQSSRSNSWSLNGKLRPMNVPYSVLDKFSSPTLIPKISCRVVCSSLVSFLPVCREVLFCCRE